MKNLLFLLSFQCLHLTSLGFVQEEADLVDPATEIKEKCAEDHCAKFKDRLDECNARVSSFECRPK
jgi:hypothetical protein